MAFLIRHFSWCWLSTLSALAGLCQVSLLHATEPQEHEVKAALIANFAHYVDWPESAPAAGRTRLCLVGRGPTVDALQQLDGRVLYGRSITILRIQRAIEVMGCQILFIGNTSQKQAADWIMDTADLPVLTISEAEDFVRRGGIVGLDRESGRVVFDVNLRAMRRNGIRISAYPLRLARLVVQ